VDLHLHSTASDGVYAPAKLIELAAVRGLSAVALTDHDTTAGLDEAGDAAKSHGIEFVPGIELDARYGSKSVHILGYFVDPASAELRAATQTARTRRENRASAILERLRHAGVELTLADISGTHGERTIGRSHIAAALVGRGAARDHDDAFTRFLGIRGAAYVPLESPTAAEAIATIRAAGGVACLAHPVWLGCASLLELETIVCELRDAGLAGLEAYHPAQAAELSSRIAAMARTLGLAVTGGSDFHALGPGSARGAGFGVRVSYECLSELRRIRDVESPPAKALTPA